MAEESFEKILDEALDEYGTDLLARADHMDPTSGGCVKDVRTRLFDLKLSQEKTGNVKGGVLTNAYLKFEEYLRVGNGDGKGSFSEFKAGRTVAVNMFMRISGRVSRTNLAQNRRNQIYWYRYRSRLLITGYRYFVATGCLLPESRGKCQGKSLIHNPNVKHYCLEIIGQLGATWSARTFRDRISAKLYSLGYIKANMKIGRCTATYFLRELGMVLVRPKKGIYKDGHERPNMLVALNNRPAWHASS